MDYESAELLDLMDKVADQGGEHLDESCVSREFEFCGPHSKPVTLRYCNNATLFAVPYEATDRAGHAAGLQPVVVCAVDDNMAMWPRFGGDKFGIDPVDEEPDPDE